MWKFGQTPDADSWRGWRGRGGRRGGGPRGGVSSVSSGRDGWERSSRSKPTSTPSPEPPLGPLLSSLCKSDFDKTAKTYESQSVITGCKTVTSYNWLDKAEPTIVVPGKPPKWTPLPEPRQLRQDDGEYLRDPNAAHYPEHPIEPAVVAGLAARPDLAGQIDIVACSSTLGNLLRFIRGEDKQFRILVELVDSTVFFIRRENTPREFIHGVKGFGHTFPEAYTTWDREVKDSTSHQRLISYRFGELDLLVRFEADGYIAHDEDEDAPRGLSNPAMLDANQAVDELSAALAGNRVNPIAPGDGHKDLKVIQGGDLVEQDHIFELKTRSIRRKEADTFEDTFGIQLPRLWVAQIPQFILAYHNHGTFEEINVRDARADVKVWEKDHVDALSRLAALIHHLIGLVRSRPDSKLELRHDAIGILEVREHLKDAGNALSESVRSMWTGGSEACQDAAVSDFEEGSDWDAGDHLDWEEGSEPDYTACSADDCGYCGRCSY